MLISPAAPSAAPAPQTPADDTAPDMSVRPAQVLQRLGPRPPPASTTAPHGLDYEYTPEGHDIFTSAFEESAAKMRELDQQNASLQRQARAFLQQHGSLTGVILSGIKPSTILNADAPLPSPLPESLALASRPLPSMPPLPWQSREGETTWAAPRSSADQKGQMIGVAASGIDTSMHMVDADEEPRRRAMARSGRSVAYQ